jgi:hypothetical protein
MRMYQQAVTALLLPAASFGVEATAHQEPAAAAAAAGY